jgi:DNA-binding response OmpR family regulator
VKKVRREIEAVEPSENLIQSVYGVGYRFEPAGG